MGYFDFSTQVVPVIVFTGLGIMVYQQLLRSSVDMGQLNQHDLCIMHWFAARIDAFLLFANRPFVQKINLDGSGRTALYTENESVMNFLGLDLDMR
jgi:hypothetical protein